MDAIAIVARLVTAPLIPKGLAQRVSPFLIETIFTAAHRAAVKILSRNYLSSMLLSIGGGLKRLVQS
jgi:hypothetical protein